VSVILTEVLEKAGLTDLTQAVSGLAGILHGAKVSFYTSAVAAQPTTPLSAFTLSADTNLLAQAITWGSAYRRVNGGVALDGGTMLIQLALIANAGPVYGYVVTDTAGAVLLYSEAFPTPITLVDTLAGFVFTPQIALGGPDNGAAIVANPPA
jgi:hypothetical protein